MTPTAAPEPTPAVEVGAWEAAAPRSVLDVFHEGRARLHANQTLRLAEEPCPTCQNGQTRETAAMVCQTCGHDYAAAGVGL